MIFNPKPTAQIEELLAVWQPYISNIKDWQELVKGVAPKQTYCGPVYELGNPLGRTTESFAIADMRGVKVAEPHYHAGETEVYFVLSGSGLTVIGGEELHIQAGDIVVTPPTTGHFTVPEKDLVLVVMNTPPFNSDNNIHLEASNPEMKYDQEQFEGLTKQDGR